MLWRDLKSVDERPAPPPRGPPADRKRISSDLPAAQSPSNCTEDFDKYCTVQCRYGARRHNKANEMSMPLPWAFILAPIWSGVSPPAIRLGPPPHRGIDRGLSAIARAVWSSTHQKLVRGSTYRHALGLNWIHDYASFRRQ